MSIPAAKELLDFTGKAMVVTGAGKGIGAGIAKRFAEAGASVVVNYRASAAGAQRVVQVIEKQGGKALAVKADVTRREEVERLLGVSVKA